MGELAVNNKNDVKTGQSTCVECSVTAIEQSRDFKWYHSVLLFFVIRMVLIMTTSDRPTAAVTPGLVRIGHFSYNCFIINSLFISLA